MSDVEAVISFVGVSSCVADNALVVISGQELRTGLPARVVFAGCQGNELPANLPALAISRSGPGEAPRWQLQSERYCFELQAHSIHVQRDVSVAFAAAVPPLPASLGGRIGWAVLLTALRIPGIARLLAAVRKG
jgi:hypothetical protein